MPTISIVHRMKTPDLELTALNSCDPSLLNLNSQMLIVGWESSLIAPDFSECSASPG